MEAIPTSLEAIAVRVEAIAIRLEELVEGCQMPKVGKRTSVFPTVTRSPTSSAWVDGRIMFLRGVEDDQQASCGKIWHVEITGNTEFKIRVSPSSLDLHCGYSFRTRTRTLSSVLPNYSFRPPLPNWLPCFGRHGNKTLKRSKINGSAK